MSEPVDLVAEVARSRYAGLVALRDLLAGELSNGGHIPGCLCDCGIAADGRVVATLAKQLSATLAEIDALPGVPDGEESAVVSLTARIAGKRAEVGRNSAASA